MYVVHFRRVVEAKASDNKGGYMIIMITSVIRCQLHAVFHQAGRHPLLFVMSIDGIIY